MELSRWMFEGGTRAASFLREESTASRLRVWMERIVRAVRVEEARATRIRRGVGPFKRERRESILSREERRCWRHGRKILR